MIDPTCLVHGLKKSEHDCIYCCLCYRSLTITECHIDPDDEMGRREDVCWECACHELEERVRRMKQH